jgi:hypothetical protein
LERVQPKPVRRGSNFHIQIRATPHYSEKIKHIFSLLLNLFLVKSKPRDEGYSSPINPTFKKILHPFIDGNNSNILMKLK